MSSELLVLSVVMGGYALWFSLAVFNNIVDFGTNRFLIGRMVSMVEILEDPNLGNKIQWRALKGKYWPTVILGTVIVYQVFAATKLLLAASALVMLLINGGFISSSLLFDMNIALTMMLVLWFGFLVGGLWFGYWIKTPQLQMVHMMLTMFTILCLLLVNVLVYITDVG